MKTLVFDGHNALWRLQKRLPELSVSGKPVQVVFGFMRLLRAALAQFEPDAAVVCFDSGFPEARVKIYPGYKHGRHHDPDEESSLTQQLKVIKQILPSINVVHLSFPNTEADDLVAITCHDLSGEKIIVSSDRDMFHLVRKNVSVWSPIKYDLYTEENFRKLTGMSPRQWLEFRVLTGDSGDGIPGVARGFGEETAKELIEKYGSIEELFLPKVEKRVSRKGNRYALLYSDGVRESVKRNFLLMDLTLPQKGENYPKISKMLEKRMARRRTVDRVTLRETFEEQKFKTLLKDFARWVRPFEDLDTVEEK
jgi:DNA polymerase-1